MLNEISLSLSILKTTKEGKVLVEDLKKGAKIPSTAMAKILEEFRSEGIINVRDNFVEANSIGRLKLAVKAAMSGIPIDQISNFLQWQEFEDITAFVLKENGYYIKTNVRFKHANRRWEIDVIGCKSPLVVCIDCKHWQRAISPSALHRIAKDQADRTRAFAESLPKPSLQLQCCRWKKAKFVPILISLIPNTQKFHDNVPIVPILQIQDFISQIPLEIQTVKHFSKAFNNLTDRL